VSETSIFAFLYLLILMVFEFQSLGIGYRQIVLNNPIAHRDLGKSGDRPTFYMAVLIARQVSMILSDTQR
jgi:hypothetical protein